MLYEKESWNGRTGRTESTFLSFSRTPNAWGPNCAKRLSSSWGSGRLSAQQGGREVVARTAEAAAEEGQRKWDKWVMSSFCWFCWVYLLANHIYCNVCLLVYLLTFSLEDAMVCQSLFAALRSFFLGYGFTNKGVSVFLFLQLCLFRVWFCFCVSLSCCVWFSRSLLVFSFCLINPVMWCKVVLKCNMQHALGS